MKKTNIIIKEGAILALITVPFFFWLFKRYMHLDFWYDEIFSFDNFIFVPLKRTVTDYGAPNNHIFSNIISNTYLKLIGIKDIFSLMDTPYKIRILPLGCSIVTLVYIYRIGKKFFDTSVAYFSLIVFVTTIPFYNFAAQVRGYSLSMTFMSMVVYHVWNFEKTLKWVDAGCVILFATLSLYTIPLNLYFLANAAIFYFVAGVHQRVFKRRHNIIQHTTPKPELKSVFQRNFSTKNTHFVIVALIGVSILIAVCIYLPFLDNIVGNRHFKSHGLFSNPQVLSGLLPQSLMHFVSKRYLFIPIAVIGLLSCLIPSIRKKNQEVAYRWVFCVTSVCTPFVLSFIRGGQPPSRAFVNLAPMFALFMAASFCFIYRAAPKICSNLLLISGIIVYCHFTFAYAVYRKDAYLKSDILQNRKTYDMYYNYFQAYYRPSKLVRDFLQHYRTDTIPITLVVNAEEYEIRRYLQKFQVNYYPHPYEVLFNSHGQAYVVTALAHVFAAKLSQTLPQSQCEILNKDINFHKILLCESPLLATN